MTLCPVDSIYIESTGKKMEGREIKRGRAKEKGKSVCGYSLLPERQPVPVILLLSLIDNH